MARMHELLRVLSIIAAMYGIGFGLMAIPTGLFVGPHILLAAAALIAFGILFALAARALANRKRWGVWLALACALFAVIAGLLGLADTLRQDDSLAWMFYVLFTAYFVLTAGIAAVIPARPKIGT
jgi:uncharacterized membrane protein YfcA